MLPSSLERDNSFNELSVSNTTEAKPCLHSFSGINFFMSGAAIASEELSQEVGVLLIVGVGLGVDAGHVAVVWYGRGAACRGPRRRGVCG
jgi:hypothetical protein